MTSWYKNGILIVNFDLQYNHINNYNFRKKNNKNGFLKALLNWGATFLLIFLKSAFYFKKFLIWFFSLFAYKPLKVILRFIFYKIVVKLYGSYLSFLNRMGWNGLRGNTFGFLFNQKLVHILVVLLTFFSVFVNLSSKTNAEYQVGDINSTILSQLIKSEFETDPEDEQLIIETFDQEATVSSLHQSYLDNLSSIKPQARVSLGEENDEEELITNQNTGSIVNQDRALTKISKKVREKTITYTVKIGDTISTIAEEFEISVSTILWENNLTAYSIIRPGNVLDILPVSGVSHTVKKGESVTLLANKYSISEVDIISFNKLDASGRLIMDQKIIIPGGRKLIDETSKPRTYSGLAVIKGFIGDSGKGILSKDIAKDFNAVPLQGNKMNWPTVGNRITQYYSWKHHAIDIANKIGTPLYAADAGVVELAGWGTGYGNQILIDHGGGKKTRYAHASKFYVERGEKVAKGQIIAAMGSTGWSTGSHIHFEVIINGVKYNPLNYIK